MLEIHCSGTPFEIGRHHGSAAREKVLGSIAFYKGLFQSTCAMDWPSVRIEASKYTDTFRRIAPRYLDEMRGVADGAGVDLLDIVALNVRTEIVFGLFADKPQLPTKTDGCTSVALKTPAGSSLLGQNWDWMVEQAPNLLVCYVSQPQTDIPGFAMVTEGGVIGKIGFNDRGVGVCLNAIRARGVDKTRLPVHLGLRAALESRSRAEAVGRLKASGIAGSAHILVADTESATGLEFTNVDEPPWLRDSPVRLTRMHQLLDCAAPPGQEITTQKLVEAFKDQEGYPCSINRMQTGESENQTVFNIVMELSKRRAEVRFGRPTDNGELLQLSL
ncbi:hypothetical protein VUR80DRAFT_8370 [Thermomyces stellatus]